MCAIVLPIEDMYVVEGADVKTLLRITLPNPKICGMQDEAASFSSSILQKDPEKEGPQTRTLKDSAEAMKTNFENVTT